MTTAARAEVTKARKAAPDRAARALNGRFINNDGDGSRLNKRASDARAWLRKGRSGGASGRSARFTGAGMSMK